MTTDSLTQIEFQLKTYLNQQVQTDSAHDMSHITRVVMNCKQLAKTEPANLAILIPAAWLHDCISLPKNHPERSKSSLLSANHAVSLLQSWQYPQQYHCAIHHAIVSHSFSAQVTPHSLEAKVLQDADRLDALGAIGISRCLLIGGALNQLLYQVDDPFCKSRSPDDQQFTIDHFYTKLLQLNQTLNTNSAKLIAQQRTQHMHNFLDQLQLELNGQS